MNTNAVFVLIKYFIKLDYRDKEHISYKKFFGIIVAYLIGSAGLAVNYYLNFDSMSFAVLCYTMNTFMLAFIAMGEYPQLFFAKEQFDLIQILPISKKDFITSKFISAILYLTSLAAVLSVSQSVFYYFYEENLAGVLIFFLLNISFTLFFSSVLLIIYSLALKLLSEKGTYILFILQFLFFGLIMYSTSIGTKAVELHTNSIMNFEFVNYLPQKYFAGGISNPLLLFSGIFLTVLLLLLLLKIVSMYFYDIYNTLYIIKPKESKIKKVKVFKSYREFSSKIFIRDRVEKSGFELAGNIITGSKSMLLRYMPLASAPVIIAVIGILTGNESLTFIDRDSQGLVIPVLSPSISIILIMMSRMFISNLQIADENSNDVNWIYESLPLESPARIMTGSFKFVFHTFILLPVVLISVLLLIKYPAVNVLLNILFILVFSVFAMTLTFLFVKNYPFTLESNKINSASKLLDVFLSVIYAVLIFILQFFVFQNYTYIFISIITILILNFLITKQIRNYGTGKKLTAERS